MKVKAIAVCPTEEDITKMGEGFRRDIGFLVTAGNVYTVLGISFFLGPSSTVFGNTVCVKIVDDEGNLVFSPLCLFEIVDRRVSRYWEARKAEAATLDLWPPSFFGGYFHDDVSNGVPDAVRELERVRALIENEFPD